MVNLSATASFWVIRGSWDGPGKISTLDDGTVVSIVSVTRYMRNTGGSRYPRHLSAVSSRGTGVPAIVRRVVLPHEVPMSIKGEENKAEDHPGHTRGPPKQNNSPTPLLGAMISYFSLPRRPYFFSLLRYVQAGERAPYAGESLTWSWRGLFNCGASFSSPVGRVGGNPARCCRGACVRAAFTR